MSVSRSGCPDLINPRGPARIFKPHFCRKMVRILKWLFRGWCKNIIFHFICAARSSVLRVFPTHGEIKMSSSWFKWSEKPSVCRTEEWVLILKNGVWKLRENFICDAVKLVSVGACEKYMTALFILHSPFMPESTIASGRRGHSEKCHATEWPCVASLISHFCADTSITLLWQNVRREKKKQ